MSPNQPRTEGKEVPFCSGRFQNRVRINVHLVEDDGQLVDQSDVEITLGVFDYLCSLGHFDGGRLMRTCCDNLIVKRIHLGSDLRG